MLKIINRFLRAKCILTIAFLMVLVLVLPQNISKAADEVIAVGRPKISVSVNGDSVIVTIKKTSNAARYAVYIKSAGSTKYELSGYVEKDGSKKRKYKLSGIEDGSYAVKVKALNGNAGSKSSKAHNFVVSKDNGKDFMILFTSDVHCGADQGFTYAGLKAVKDSLSMEHNVLLVDDGDSIQGEPLGTLTKGEAMIDLMNTVGYDVAIPGNHEFDYGMERFLELAEKAQFPYISCNFNKEGELVFAPYVIKYVSGKKIAFVGITTPKTITSSTPKYFMDDNGNFIYGFMQDQSGEKLYTAVQNAVDSARKEGADYVVAMAHLGNEANCVPWTYVDVITHTNGIDVFLDGHSHDTDYAVVNNKDGQPVQRQACGTKLACIGWVNIDSTGKISTGLYNWNNSESALKLLGIKNELSDMMSITVDSVNNKLEEVVAYSDFDLTIFDPVAKDENGNPIRIVRMAETNLGDLCADAYRDQSGADIAIVNGGGIRVSIGKGDITYRDIINVHPFGNMLTVVEATGQQILDALEWGCRTTPSSTGGFPQVSGLTFEIHTYLDSTCTSDENKMFTGITGEYRVKNVKVGGKAIDPDKTYTLASHDYMLLNNGDGYTMFDGCKVLQESVKLDNQVLIDYLEETLNGKVSEKYSNPYGDGRIVAVEGFEDFR